MTKEAPHYVVGHTNPDTDSIVGAFVLAWYHRQLNPASNATAVRLGAVNRQTAWLFDDAGCALPQLRQSCLYRADEIASSVPVVSPDSPFREALETMLRAKSNFVAVVDAERRPLGIVSDRSPRTNYILQCNLEDFIGTLISFEHLINGLPLKALRAGREMQIHSLKLPLHKSTLKGEWDAHTAIVIGDRELFLETICQNPPGAVVLTGVTVERAEVMAAKLPCPVYLYEGTAISLFSRLNGCFPASAAMVDDFVTIDESCNADEINSRLKKSNYGLMVLDAEGRVSGAITAMDLLQMPRPKVSLVDHSERGQSMNALESAEVVEIIDHHRLGDVETIEPLSIDVRPLGSTASILYDRIRDAEVSITPAIAKLLLGALISDTLLLTSPTCTRTDRSYAESLAKLAGVDLHAFGLQVLRENDELTTAEPKQLVRRDCKQFNFEGVQFYAAQIETVDLNALTVDRVRALSEEFHAFVNAQGAEFGVLMITDVLESVSRIVIVSDDRRWVRVHVPEAVVEAAAPWVESGFVSRKKQLIPLLLKNIQASK